MKKQDFYEKDSKQLYWFCVNNGFGKGAIMVDLKTLDEFDQADSPLPFSELCEKYVDAIKDIVWESYDGAR